MPYTGPLTVNAVGFTAVIVQSDYCVEVVVKENPGVSGWPTSDFLVAKPLQTSQTIRVSAGQAYIFTPPTDARCFKQGNVAGYLEMVTGATTFDQDEN